MGGQVCSSCAPQPAPSCGRAGRHQARRAQQCAATHWRCGGAKGGGCAMSYKERPLLMHKGAGLQHS